MITVTGNIVNASDAPVYALVTFTPQSTPLVESGGVVIVPNPINIYSNPSTGFFSVALEAGDYLVVYSLGVTPACQFQIAVPSGTATVTIDTLVTTSLTYTYATPPSYLASFPLGVSQALTNGVSSGSVAYALAAAPAAVILTVETSDNTAIFATLNGDPTATGFDFTLSAQVGSGAKLRALLYPSGGTSVGVISLSASVVTFTVSGLALAFTPSAVVLTVEAPDGSAIAAALSSDPTSDGFGVNLTAGPLVSGCKLHYVCVQ